MDAVEELETRAAARADSEYGYAAESCPNGLQRSQLGDVTVVVTSVGASRPVVEGTASADSYGTQTWTFNWETETFAWTSDFCAGRDVGE